MIYRNGVPFNINSSFEANGINYPSNWYYYATDEEKQQLGFTEGPDLVLPESPFYYYSGTTLSEKPFDVCQEIYRTELATIRWGYESAGVVYNDVLYTTDPESKLNYLGALQRSLLDPTYTVIWKARTVSDPNSAVFVNLSASDMINIANFAISYITACFETENSKFIQINNTTTLQELTSIDLNSDWPSRYYN